MDRLPEWLKKYVGAAEHAHWADCSSRDTYDWMYNAIRAFLNAAEKDGWVMVPREATPSMVAAGLAADPLSCDVNGTEYDIYPTVYRAMIDAAKEERS